MSAAARELVERTTRAQGLPMTVDDAAALARVAHLLRLPVNDEPTPTNDAPATSPTRDDHRRSTYVQPQPEPAISS